MSKEIFKDVSDMFTVSMSTALLSAVGVMEIVAGLSKAYKYWRVIHALSRAVRA